MPRDVSQDALGRFENSREFRREYGVDRDAVADGLLKIVKAGDGSVHPIEDEFLSPEIHSLMSVDHPVVRNGEFDRVVLMVDKPSSDLDRTYVSKYLKYGETHSFQSDKSKSVPVPQRSTVKARDPWFNLTKLVNPGFALWPKAQQYRHIVPANPDRLICNCNLYDMAPKGLSETEQQILIAVLNSTLVGFMKTFYGRFAGTEGNLKTEIVDVNLLDVPNPKGASNAVATKLAEALSSMQSRSVGRLVEEQLMECHLPERARRIAEGPLVLSRELREPDRRTLDEATFELLGVADPDRRKKLVDQLHIETALHFRNIRVVEIQKMEQRRKSANRQFSAEELSADLWDAAELEDLTPLREWLAYQPIATAGAIIPEGSPAYLSNHAKMFDNNTVYFGKDRKDYMVCKSRAEAELIKLLADLGLHGAVNIPPSSDGSREVSEKVRERIGIAKARFEELANTRTGLEDKQTEVVDLLLRWFVLGRQTTAPSIQ